MTNETTTSKTETCGIIMPISALDGCPESHWVEVASIIKSAIEDAGYDANIVSNAIDSGVIQKRIVQNLYGNPLVVCDVSGKNPNVMFELGMRLAFDKPTVIVKDDATDYSFDTSLIEHLEYPRDLRFSKIIQFKKDLAEKLKATRKASDSPEYSTFLKHFGELQVASIGNKEVSEKEYFVEQLRDIRQLLESMRMQSRVPRVYKPEPIASRGRLRYAFTSIDSKNLKNIAESVALLPAVETLEIQDSEHGGQYMTVHVRDKVDASKLDDEIASIINNCSAK